MKCPIDGATLVVAERRGVEIDYCPECRGVWLDRGELDKIIEASHQPEPRGKYGDRGPARPSQGVPQKPYSSQVGRKKKSGFGGLLDDIFDF